MEFAKCFDVVTMVTDEATEQFGCLLQEDRLRKAGLEEACELLDLMAGKVNGVAFEAEVDDETMEITVSLECGWFETWDWREDFYQLVGSAKKLRFRPADAKGDAMLVDFVFEGIWTPSI